MEKKRFSLIAVSILAVIIWTLSLAACSSGEDISPPKVTENVAYEELMGALVEYTDQFNTTLPKQSRGDAGFGDFIKAIKADHVGYSNGSTVISISQSRKKWKELKQKERETEQYELLPIERENLELQIDYLVEAYKADNLNVGAYHNAVILQAILDDDMDFETTDELVKSVLRTIKKLGLAVPKVDVKQTAKEIDDFFAKIYDDNTIIMYDRLIAKYPERKQELLIQKQFLLSTENRLSAGDIKNFSDGYITIINQSKIPVSSKQQLVSNITIAPASYNLWRQIDTIAIKQ